MSIFSPPKPPNPAVTAAAQAQANQAAARSQQEMNMVNQQTPFGSLNYQQTGTNPDGTPIFSAVTSLNPQQQGLLDTRVATQGSLGDIGKTLAGNMSNYGNLPDLGVEAMTKKLMGWGETYMQPIFDAQQRALDAKLQNQGIAMGGPNTAWDIAQKGQARNVNEAYANLFRTSEQQAFDQALQEYQLPMQTLQFLMGGAAPQLPEFQKTPTSTVASPDIMKATQDQFNARNQQYQNMINGLMNVGTAVAGGWATGGFPMPSFGGGGGTGGNIPGYLGAGYSNNLGYGGPR